MVTLKGEDRPRCAHAITWGRYKRTRQKCIVAMKPNGPNPLSQFDRAAVNRPLMRARLGGRRGELRPHHLRHPAGAPAGCQIADRVPSSRVTMPHTDTTLTSMVFVGDRPRCPSCGEPMWLVRVVQAALSWVCATALDGFNRMANELEAGASTGTSSSRLVSISGPSWRCR